MRRITGESILIPMNAQEQAATSGFIHRLRNVWQQHDFQFGIPVVDLQHIHLLYTFVDLAYVLEKGSENLQRQYEESFSRIMDFTSEHFFLEAEIFKRFNFPGKKEHLVQHGEFINKLKKRSRETADGNPQVGRELVSDMMSWLFDHILVEDRQYVQFFRNEPYRLIDYTDELVQSNEIYITRQQVDHYRAVTGLDIRLSIHEEDVDRTIFHMWKTYDLSIEIPLLDLQHLWFLYLMIRLDRATKIQERDARVRALTTGFEQLHNFFHTHFQTEEKLMEVFQYPGVAQHKMMHAKMKSRLEIWSREIQKKGDRTPGFAHTLKDWLMSHIAISDKDLTFFFRKRKAEVKRVSKELIQSGFVYISKGQMSLYNRVLADSRQTSRSRT